MNIEELTKILVDYYYRVDGVLEKEDLDAFHSKWHATKIAETYASKILHSYRTSLIQQVEGKRIKQCHSLCSLSDIAIRSHNVGLEEAITIIKSHDNEK